MLDGGFVHVFVAGGVFAKLVSPANDASRFTEKIACEEQSRRANSPGDDKQSGSGSRRFVLPVDLHLCGFCDRDGLGELFLFGRGRSGGAFADDF